MYSSREMKRIMSNDAKTFYSGKHVKLISKDGLVIQIGGKDFKRDEIYELEKELGEAMRKANWRSSAARVIQGGGR